MADSHKNTLGDMVSDLASRCLSAPWEHTQQQLGALMQALQTNLSAMAASNGLRPEPLQYASTVLFPAIQHAQVTKDPIALSHTLHDLLGPWLTELQANSIEPTAKPNGLA